MNAIKELNIDKSQWMPVKFGDVAFEPKETVKDPQAEGVEHVVGLEHIASENIHLVRSENLDQSTTFTKKFAVGDVLFGRRRAYLKKAAQASFEGICSGDITVLRAKDNLLPELLPFVVQNEKFFDYAIKHSAGGLSPRVKFKDLANYQFLLPPESEQVQLAELLWAMDVSVQTCCQVFEKLKCLRDSYLKRIFLELPYEFKNAEIVEIGTLIKLSSGKTRPQDLVEFELDEYKYPVYGGNGIIGYSKEYLVDYPTIILGRVGEYCGAVHNSSLNSWISDNALYVTKFMTDIDKLYLSRYLEFIDLNKQQNRSSYPLITQGKVNKNKICLLPEEVISSVMEKLFVLEKLNSEANLKTGTSKKLLTNLISGVF